MSDASGSCLQGILPWWDCSGGGVCVSTPSSPASLITHNVSSSIWNTYNLSYGISADTTTLANHLLMCKCHPDYANVVFLWFISPGDCYVHGLARDVLLWIALLSSALGCVYALLRIACGAPRGRRGCAMSCMAALSLGYPCQPCLHVCMRKSSKDKSVPTTKSSSSLSKHSAAASASGITTSAAAALADWQVIGARGFPMVVAMSLFFLTLYFLGAICAPQILRSGETNTKSPIISLLQYGLWTVLILGITGVAFGVAHIGQRQVIVASGPAFHRMRRMDRRHKGLMTAQRCFNIGRVVTVVTFLIVCALVTSGIVLLVTAPAMLPVLSPMVTTDTTTHDNNTTSPSSTPPTTMDTTTAITTNTMYKPFLRQQIVGVQLFGAGITVACVVFASVMAISSTFVIRIIKDHLSISSTFRGLSSSSTTTTTTTAAIAGVAAASHTDSAGGTTNSNSNNNKIGSKKQQHPSAVAVSTASDAFAVVILKLSRLRLLVVACLFGSLTIGAVMMIVPGSIEYIFPISVINGSLLLSVYIAIDSGIATTSYQKQTTLRKQHHHPKYASSLTLDSAQTNLPLSSNDNNHTTDDILEDNTTYRCGPCWLDGEGLLTFYGSTIVSSRSSASSSSPAVSNSAKGTISSSGPHSDMAGDMSSYHYDVERGEIWAPDQGGTSRHYNTAALASISMVVNAPHSTTVDDNMTSVDANVNDPDMSSDSSAEGNDDDDERSEESVWALSSSSSIPHDESSSYSASVDYSKTTITMDPTTTL